jgi:hypothetical protein
MVHSEPVAALDVNGNRNLIRLPNGFRADRRSVPANRAEARESRSGIG